MKFIHTSILFFCLIISHNNYSYYQYIKFLKDVTIADIMTVGGKNASLGHMINALSSQGIRVPHGFAITVDGYNHYINSNNFTEKINLLLNEITDYTNIKQLKNVSSSIRELIENGTIPEDLSHEICAAYQELSDYYNEKNCDVAVRSSATAEDLPNASFAGQKIHFSMYKEKKIFFFITKNVLLLFLLTVQ